MNKTPKLPLSRTEFKSLLDDLITKAECCISMDACDEFEEAEKTEAHAEELKIMAQVFKAYSDLLVLVEESESQF